MRPPTLKVFRIHKDIIMPTVATKDSACFDVRFQIEGSSNYTGFDSNNTVFTRNFSNNKAVIMPGERALLPTGLIFDIPVNHSIRAHIRSSAAFKRGLFLANSEGIIDADYYHQTYILLYNSTSVKQEIENKERLMQCELVRNLFYHVEETLEQPSQKTDRTGGVGSTGTN